jgi:hypothetical protein
MFPLIQVRRVNWRDSRYEFGDGTATALEAGELDAYDVVLVDQDGEELAKSDWPQADLPGLAKTYPSPFLIPRKAGQLRDLAADMWTGQAAEVGSRFVPIKGCKYEGQVVTVQEIEHDDRGTDGSWMTGHVLVSPESGKVVRLRLDQLRPADGE